MKTIQKNVILYCADRAPAEVLKKIEINFDMTVTPFSNSVTSNILCIQGLFCKILI